MTFSNTIYNAFLVFEEKIKNGELWKYPVQLDEQLRRTYKMQEVEKYPKGIFLTFDDFKDNKSTPLDFRAIIHSSHIGKKYDTAGLKIKNGEYWEKGVWGFSDGENLFMRIGNRFHRIYKEDNVFQLKFLPPSQNSEAVFIAAALGGVFAGLIVDGIIDANKTIKNWKVNILTGGLLPHQVSEKASIVIYNSKFKNLGNIAKLELNGIEVCEIEKNSAFLFHTNDYNSEIEICVEMEGEENCRTIKPTLEQLQVYNLSTHKKKGLLFEVLIGNARQNTIQDIQTERISVNCEEDQTQTNKN